MCEERSPKVMSLKEIKTAATRMQMMIMLIRSANHTEMDLVLLTYISSTAVAEASGGFLPLCGVYGGLLEEARSGLSIVKEVYCDIEGE